MRILTYTIGLLTALSLVSCLSDDSDLQTLIEENPGRIIPPTIEFDESDLDEGLDIIVTDPEDEAYNDYWENSPWTTNVKVTFTPEGATVSGTTTRVKATVEGGHVLIKATASRVNITASGECPDGSLKVYSDYKFKLTLNGLNLTNPHGAAINNQCGKTIYLVINQGTVNRLSDGPQYTDVPEDEDMKGTLFSEGQIIVSGSGQLRVSSKGGRHAIASDDYLRFRKGNKITVESTSGNGIRGKDGIYIDGSVINVSTTAPAGRALATNGYLHITGGRTTLLTTGCPTVNEELADTTSAAGIKCDSIMTMTGGTLRIKSTGDGGKGIKAHGTIAMQGGKVEIVTLGIKDLASPKGIKCDGAMDVLAPSSIYIYSAHAAPVDATPLTLTPGYKSLEQRPRLFTIAY